MKIVGDNTLIFSTGSKGNAILYDNILIDCGVSAKVLNNHIHKIQLVFISHRHIDHWKESALKLFEKHEIPVYASPSDKRFFNKMTETPVNYIEDELVTFENDFGDTYEISTFPLFHDVKNIGFKIVRNGVNWIVHATDTGHMNGIEAKDFEYYFIEANYNTWKIDQIIASVEKKGKFNRFSRSKKTHLSKQQCDKWVGSQRGKSFKGLVYLHKSSRTF